MILPRFSGTILKILNTCSFGDYCSSFEVCLHGSGPDLERKPATALPSPSRCGGSEQVPNLPAREIRHVQRSFAKNAKLGGLLCRIGSAPAPTARDLSAQPSGLGWRSSHSSRGLKGRDSATDCRRSASTHTWQEFRRSLPRHQNGFKAIAAMPAALHDAPRVCGRQAVAPASWSAGRSTALDRARKSWRGTQD